MNYRPSSWKFPSTVASIALITCSLAVLQSSAQAAAPVNGLIYIDQGPVSPLLAVNESGASSTRVQPLTSQITKWPSFSMDGKKLPWVDSMGSSVV